MKETKWTRIVCRQLEALNGYIFVIGGGKNVGQTLGLPDRYLAHRRWRGWLEFKGAKTAVSDLQRIHIRELNARGDNAYFVRMPGQVEDWQGNVLATFDGTGADLLNALEMLCEDSQS